MTINILVRVEVATFLIANRIIVVVAVIATIIASALSLLSNCIWVRGDSLSLRVRAITYDLCSLLEELREGWWTVDMWAI